MNESIKMLNLMQHRRFTSAGMALAISASSAVGATMTFDFEPSTRPVIGAGSGCVGSEAKEEYSAKSELFALTSCGSPAYALLVKSKTGCHFAETLAASAGNMAAPSHVESFASVGLTLGSGNSFSIDSLFVDELTAADAILLTPAPKGSVSQVVAGWVDTSPGHRDFLEERMMSGVASKTMTTQDSAETFYPGIDVGMASMTSEPVSSGLLLLAVVPFVFRVGRGARGR